MELKELNNFVQENKNEYLKCIECNGEGYLSSDGLEIEPCNECDGEGK